MLAVTFSSVALSIATAGSAAAASAVVTTPGGIAVDGTLHKVFVGDRSSGKITATDYNGTVVDSVSGISGVRDLALSDDGSVLYAAAETSHQIVALDAATLDVKTRYDIPTTYGPMHVAFTAGKVWFTYGLQSNGNLGSVDPNPGTTPDPTPTDTATPDPTPTDTATADPTPSDSPTADPTTDPTADPTADPTSDPTTDPTADPTDSATTAPAPALAPADTPKDPVALGQFPAPGTLYGAGILSANPSVPGMLAVGETDNVAGAIAVVDVSSGTPQSVSYRERGYTPSIGDIDLVPGSTPQVLVNGTQRVNYADGNLIVTGSYPEGSSAVVAPDGLVAQLTGTQIAVYRPNATKPLRYFAAGGAGVGDMAWAPDSSRVFALEKKGSTYTLTPLTSPTKNVPTLTVTAPSSVSRAKAFTVSGKLSTTVPLPAGVTLSVTRTDLESPKGKALPAAHLKADGSFSFTDTPPAGGTVTYKVTYAGDAGHITVTTSRNVTVSRSATSLSLSNTGKTYSYNSKVTFTAHLGTTYKNRTVEIWADPYGGDKPNKLVKSGTVNSKGQLSATIQLVRDTNLTVVFKGDSRTAPKTLKAKAYTRVSVSTSVSRYYKTAKIGSTSYYWFHKSTAPYITTTMTYYPGRAHRLELQLYYSGGWHTTAAQYFKLGTSGKTIVDLGAPGRSGIKARIRSAYIDASSGDNVNTTTYGTWKYLYFSS